ncbi:hypothetical protein HPG69_002106 [Diceros bicornis minor]|uniref:Ig-like domain-containing protein n=1 Tax=Diceros bicornis minor TaxID=77932 RepID=A0A7J7FCH7_DICBM|nr:hypothetical protein HPG69_002106 [Diceros bicornis minor]
MSIWKMLKTSFQEPISGGGSRPNQETTLPSADVWPGNTRIESCLVWGCASGCCVCFCLGPPTEDQTQILSSEAWNPRLHLNYEISDKNNYSSNIEESEHHCERLMVSSTRRRSPKSHSSQAALWVTKSTQSNAMESTEEDPVHLPCNHPTIGGNKYIYGYIYWYRQIPTQGPEYVIHGLKSNVTSGMLSVTITTDIKSSTLILPQATLRDTAVYYCIVRGTLGQRGLHLCNTSLVGKGSSIGHPKRRLHKNEQKPKRRRRKVKEEQRKRSKEKIMRK